MKFPRQSTLEVAVQRARTQPLTPHSAPPLTRFAPCPLPPNNRVVSLAAQSRDGCQKFVALREEGAGDSGVVFDNHGGLLVQIVALGDSLGDGALRLGEALGSSP